jgi:hypothetical protein
VLHDLGLAPRFLAKSSLFEGRGFVATVLRGAGQIPVHRQTADAAQALDAAVASLARGETVVIYPEGTVTRDPDAWPMVARTGVARLALLSGAPCAACRAVGRAGGPGRPQALRPFPRRTVRFRLGPPVDLSDFAGRPLSAEVLARGPSASWTPSRGSWRCCAVLLRRHPGWSTAAPRRTRRTEDGVTRAAVLGSGSWGTAFGKVLADAGTDVVLWARRPELAAAVRDRHENPDYLPGHRAAAPDDRDRRRAEAVDGADFVVLAVPSQSLRGNLSAVAPGAGAGAVLVSLMKGVELGTTSG